MNACGNQKFQYERRTAHGLLPVTAIARLLGAGSAAMLGLCIIGQRNPITLAASVENSPESALAFAPRRERRTWRAEMPTPMTVVTFQNARGIAYPKRLDLPLGSIPEIPCALKTYLTSRLAPAPRRRRRNRAYRCSRSSLNFNQNICILVREDRKAFDNGDMASPRRENAA